GGPIGRLVDGDIVRVVIDTRTLDGSIDLMDGDTPADAALATRSMRPDLAPDPALPDATRIWAAMQQVSGGTWGGCVYDADAIVATRRGAPPVQPRRPRAAAAARPAPRIAGRTPRARPPPSNAYDAARSSAGRAVVDFTCRCGTCLKANKKRKCGHAGRSTPYRKAAAGAPSRSDGSRRGHAARPGPGRADRSVVAGSTPGGRLAVR